MYFSLILKTTSLRVRGIAIWAAYNFEKIGEALQRMEGVILTEGKHILY